MFNEARHFGSRLCFLLQARKTPTLVYPLDRVIVSQWAMACPGPPEATAPYKIITLSSRTICVIKFFQTSHLFLLFTTKTHGKLSDIQQIKIPLTELHFERYLFP